MDELAQLRASLLTDRPSRWPKRGATAFRLHKLLAAAVHRATKLAGTGDKEGEAWVAYFVEHFPEGRNGEADARLLWKDWRTALLKTDAPGPSVAVTHGQSHAHWVREDGRLVLNLEDMWADFAVSVESLIASLRASPERTEVVINRWRRWEVVQIGVTTTASVAAATVIAPQDWPPHRSD